MARPAHGVRRIGRHDLAGDQPVEEHADTGQVLLDRGRRPFRLQGLDVGGDMHRLHILQPAKTALLAPDEEGARRPGVGRPGVAVADIDGEELEEAPSGPLPRPRDQRR